MMIMVLFNKIPIIFLFFISPLSLSSSYLLLAVLFPASSPHLRMGIASVPAGKYARLPELCKYEISPAVMPVDTTNNVVEGVATKKCDLSIRWVPAHHAVSLKEINPSEGYIEDGEDRLTWKLKGAPNLYVFLEDRAVKYDYDALRKDSNGWDYITGTNINKIRGRMYKHYGDKGACIENFVFRTHGASKEPERTGPVIGGKVITKLDSLNAATRFYYYTRFLLTNDATILFTACSICKPQGTIITIFGEYFLKHTDRVLYMNRTRTLTSQCINEITNKGNCSKNDFQIIRFDAWLVYPHEKYGYTGGYVQVRWNSFLQKIRFKNVYFDARVQTSTWWGRTATIGIKEMEYPAKTDLK